MAAVTTMQMQMDKFKDREHNPQKASGIGLPGIIFNAVLLGYFCFYLNQYPTGCWADKEGTYQQGYEQDMSSSLGGTWVNVNQEFRSLMIVGIIFSSVALLGAFLVFIKPVYVVG